MANLRLSTKKALMNITKSKLSYLLSNLFIVFSIGVSSLTMAQTYGGGTGGSDGQSPGGANSVTGPGGNGTSNSGNQGAGGGGAGFAPPGD